MMIRWRLLPMAAGCTGLSLVAVGGAQAGGLEVAPIGLDFAVGQMAHTLTVTNQSDAQATVQLRTFAWSQPGDADKLAPTDAVVASPPIVIIPPGREQVVRVLLRQPPTGAAERSYRLMIDEIPAVVPGKINVALHLSLPVFVASAVPGQAKIAWSARRPAQGGSVELVAHNSGTKHIRFNGLTLCTQGGAASPAFGGYVLAGQEKRWRIMVPGLDRAGSAVLRGTDDQGEADVPLTFSGTP
jgi:fimbrial chaperone protein